MLHIENGCNNHPGVDDDGRLSQGLKGSGKDDGDCRDPDGPSYVRWKYLDAKNTSLAIVTAFYFPKSTWVDTRPRTLAKITYGERHFWQCFVSFFTIQRPQKGPPVANLTSGRVQPMLCYEDFSNKAHMALDSYPFYRSKSPVATGIFDNIVQSTWYLESTKRKQALLD
ncbi:hypothetical protein ACQY0O_004806 [Thecaphora frezii]